MIKRSCEQSSMRQGDRPEKPRSDLSIIVVNWNSKDYLHSCLRSISETTGNLGCEVIVVDSASFDGCAEMLRSEFPHVRFIQSDRNIGFARSNNLGAALSRSNRLLFLNPDTEVRGSALHCLLQFLGEVKRPGVLGAHLVNSDGSLQASAVMPFPTILNQVLDVEFLQHKFRKFGLWQSALTYLDATAPVAVPSVSGACMLIERRLFERIGGFSEDYFMYAEDVDLCYKASAEGFVNYYIPDATVVHHGGGSTRKTSGHFAEMLILQSTLRFLTKTRGHAYAVTYRASIFGAAAVRLLLLLLSAPALAVYARRRGRWINSTVKWWGVARWTLGLETGAQRPDRIRSQRTAASTNH